LGLPETQVRKLRALYLAVQQQPWRMCVLIRLIYIPVGLKNYGMATLPMPWHVYLLASMAIGLIYQVGLTPYRRTAACPKEVNGAYMERRRTTGPYMQLAGNRYKRQAGTG
jgi:hypothetical protein